MVTHSSTTSLFQIDSCHWQPRSCVGVLGGLKWRCAGDSSERFFLQSDLLKVLRLEWREWHAGAAEYKAGQEVFVKAVAIGTSTHGGLELRFSWFCEGRSWFIVFTILWWQKYFFSSLPSKIWMRWVSLYLAIAIGSIAAQYGDDGWVDDLKILISEHL